jgi:hypothetical protein
MNAVVGGKHLDPRACRILTIMPHPDNELA